MKSKLKKRKSMMKKTLKKRKKKMNIIGMIIKNF